MTVTEKMHCPRCGQKYPDAYQRFCDLDGARLVPDDAAPSGRDVGVFTSILGKPQSQVAEAKLPDELALDDRRTDTDRRKDLRLRALFDQIDLDDPSLTSDSFVIEEAPKPKPAIRRVDPNEIPSGTIDVETRELLPAYLNQFDPKKPADFVGSTVKGRYRVTEVIGEDDTGWAYLAEDRIVGDRRVVVRVLGEAKTSDEITKSIIAEERVSLSHIIHPNVARLFDSGSWANGTSYLISEHLEGLTLEDVLTIHGRLSAERISRIVKQAAYALSEVHQEGILHRDIRTANLVLVNDGETETVKITNFGVSDGVPNAANAMYQSPETLDGGVATLASDIFSLGVVAYELLHGKMPFQGETDVDVAKAQRAFASFNGTTELAGLFAKVFAISPRERYATAREFGDEFAHAVSLMPTVISEHTAPDVVDKPADAVQQEQMFKPDGTPLSPDDPQWARRSPEPIAEPNEDRIKLFAIGFALLLAAVIVTAVVLSSRTAADPAANAVTNSQTQDTNRAVVPPLERRIPQPENTNYFQSSKQNVRGDLIRNFVGFKLYYPKSWTDNRAREAASSKTRGKFLDISKAAQNGGLAEQMLVSYYPSKGTFLDDEIRFGDLVKESSDTLKELIPNFQIVSEGPIKVNDWDAYELKFQGSGTNAAGERLLVWGRRIFVPAARPGVRNGFEITMLATSNSDVVRSVDDVGAKGDLAGILYSFEPSQNF